MKVSSRPKLTMLPLLGLLAMSPSVYKSSNLNRSIASIEEKKSHPLFEQEKAKLKISDSEITTNLNVKEFKKKKEDLVKKINTLKSVMNKPEVHKAIHELIVLEAKHSKLEENCKEMNSEMNCLSDTDKDEALKIIASAKDDLEISLEEIECSDYAIAHDEGHKIVSKKEDKAEKEKVEEKPTEQTAQEICSVLEEKNKVLTTQVEELLKQQNQILQSMVSMVQMMSSMHQQLQQQPLHYQQSLPMQSPYQYHFYVPQMNHSPNTISMPQQQSFSSPYSSFLPNQAQSYSPSSHEPYSLLPGQLQPGSSFPQQEQYPMIQTYLTGSFGQDPGSFNMQPSLGASFSGTF